MRTQFQVMEANVNANVSITQAPEDPIMEAANDKIEFEFKAIYKRCHTGRHSWIFDLVNFLDLVKISDMYMALCASVGNIGEDIETMKTLVTLSGVCW